MNILQTLRDVLKTHKPGVCVVEGLFYAQNLQTALTMGEARGASLVAVAEAGLEIYEIAPRKVKQAIVGYGAAQKVAVAKMVQEQPGNGPALCALGVLDAALGNKKEAIQEGRRAVELLPVEKDSVNGALLIQYLCIIYAWAGEKDLALEELSRAIKLPGYLSYGSLRLDPIWEPLRGDPRTSDRREPFP